MKIELPRDPEIPPLGISLEKTMIPNSWLHCLWRSGQRKCSAEIQWTIVIVILVAKLCSTHLQAHGTIAHQAPLSMGFPRQVYWSVLPFPSPRDLPNLEIKPASLLGSQILYHTATREVHNGILLSH